MDLGQILLGALAVAIIWFVFSRRPRSGAVQTEQPGRRVDRSPGPLTRLEDVVPLPAPPGWPALPVQPPGLDGQLEESGRLPVADRPYARTTCPHCEGELAPLPKAKKRCPACGKAIYVKTGPDDRRYLLRDDELAGLEARWTDVTSARVDQARALQRAALEIWHDRLQAARFAVGWEDLDVVGESHYHAALAGIRDALRSDDPGAELRAAAVLRREPENAYDRNAIGVYIHGAKVGHLDRYDAEEYQPLLRRRGDLWVQAILVGGRMTPVGEVGPIGVKLDDIPAADA